MEGFATDARPGEAVPAFGPAAPPCFALTLWLSHSGNLAEAAANLFAMLRRLDRPDFSGIAATTAAELRIRGTIRPRRQLPGTACQPVLHWVTYG